MSEKTPNNRSGKDESGIGPVVGTFIIVILLIITALYIWSEHLNTAAQIQQEEQSLGTTTTTVIYSTSTEPADIQKDLQANPAIQNPGF